MSQSQSALLMIDVINHLEFDGNEGLLRAVPNLIKNLKPLSEFFRFKNIPVIYLNDNFNNWHSDFAELVEYCTSKNVNGKELAENLRPTKDDYFILKPMHSGFYGTPLHILLQRLAIKNLFLTGIAADICVQYTANDAYMRNYKVNIVSDCVIANTLEDTKYALDKMKRLLKAPILTADEVKSVV
ncbi:MAG: cysteine hydrolase [Cyanobacteria bacterium TGS_CYA1]|nr:cysteine hydrolase [Cyanobacteria bacterium TGS_CYA1]